MINTQKKEVALWTFRKPSLEKKRHYKTNESNGFDELHKVLNILYFEELFFTKEFYVLRSHLKKSRIHKSIEHLNSNPNDVINEIINTVNNIKNTGLIFLRGWTEILINVNKKQRIENIFELEFSLGHHELNISTFSDVWVPRSLDGQLQIELAELNSPRLKKCLQNIKQELNYEEVYPSEYEAIWDEQLGQKGFDIYLEEDITKRPDFPADKHEVVQKFLWKNR